MGCNSCKKNQTCDKCAPKARYCGVDLTCLGVTKGESYDSILQKLNTLFCTEIEGTTYVFGDNELCESTGFTVTQVQGDVEEVIFEYCQECCGTEGLASIASLDNPMSFDESNDTGDTPFTLPFNIGSEISDTEITITEEGDYTANFDFTVYSTYDLAVNYRLTVNGTPVITSTKSVIIDGATPPVNTQTYVLNSILKALELGDIVNVEFKTVSSIGGSPDPDNIFVTSATLILNKI